MGWHALYVHSRAEKKVAERLAGKGFEVFCPLETVWKQWSDRKKKVEQPFFRSYVFARFDAEQRTAVLQTLGVVNVVYWLKKPAIIPDREMQSVMDFFKQHAHQAIKTEAIQVGQRRSIIEGLLKDRVGIVIQNNHRKVVLEIKELGLLFTVNAEQTIMAE